MTEYKTDAQKRAEKDAALNAAEKKLKEDRKHPGWCEASKRILDAIEHAVRYDNMVDEFERKAQAIKRDGPLKMPAGANEDEASRINRRNAWLRNRHHELRGWAAMCKKRADMLRERGFGRGYVAPHATLF